MLARVFTPLFALLLVALHLPGHENRPSGQVVLCPVGRSNPCWTTPAWEESGRGSMLRLVLHDSYGSEGQS